MRENEWKRGHRKRGLFSIFRGVQLWAALLAIFLALLFGLLLYVLDRGSWGRIPLPARIRTPDSF